MQIKDIRRLLDVIKDTEVNELTLETGEYKLTVKLGLGGHQVYGTAPMAGSMQHAAAAPASQPAQPAPASEAPAQAAAEAPAKDEKLIDVTAPIVGTFYSSPSPDAPPYVREGDSVKAGSVLCIIEAMKLMNEIEADVAGVVREVLVDNGQPVEYGQVLFRIEPG
ncbi:MAG TPA: acetyl-CoA carboxylase biotin carboxyl carrier protein [Trueperaceae bacterium]|nr:acetyl-CoA carboxylase biotin carboxyl carrier protein [Trueperaceae bacterium]